jgi:hypothetical protein
MNLTDFNWRSVGCFKNRITQEKIYSGIEINTKDYFVAKTKVERSFSYYKKQTNFMEKRNLNMGSRIIEILRNNIVNVSLTTYLLIEPNLNLHIQ